MGVVKRMADVAAECVNTPGRGSIWSPHLRRYVCSNDPEFERALADQTREVLRNHPPISSAFKLVLSTAAGGTLLFVVICVATTLLAGRDPPPLTEKLVMALVDMAKIGFGAIVGLLGSHSIKG